MNIKLFGNRVLIERINPLKSEGGILFPSEWTQKHIKGKVLQVGNGIRDPKDSSKFLSMDIKVGDIIICSKFDGDIIEDKEDEKKYWIIEEKDILVILEEDDNM